MKMLACLIAVVFAGLAQLPNLCEGCSQTDSRCGRARSRRTRRFTWWGSLIRTKNGITASINMPTPAPGSYDYPPANPFQPVAPVPGTPEVFTGWFFFFNDPEKCAVPNGCIPPPPGAPAPNDFTEGRGGVYNFAGHAISGRGSLNLVGHISVGETQFGGPYALDNPAGAEIHLAVAPHGVLVPALMPQQINTPVGSPPFWWLALLKAPVE